MADAEEIQYNNDCLVITINIVDCPMAEILLTEVFNITTMSLLDNYHDVIRDTVLQQLEDTTWLLEEQVSCPQPQFFYLFAKACAPAIDHSTPQRSSKPVKPGPRSHLDPFPDPRRRHSQTSRIVPRFRQCARKLSSSLPQGPSVGDRHFRPRRHATRRRRPYERGDPRRTKWQYRCDRDRPSSRHRPNLSRTTGR